MAVAGSHRSSCKGRHGPLPIESHKLRFVSEPIKPFLTLCVYEADMVIFTSASQIKA